MNNQQLLEYVHHRSPADDRVRCGRLSKIMQRARRAATLHHATLASGFGVRVNVTSNI